MLLYLTRMYSDINKEKYTFGYKKQYFFYFMFNKCTDYGKVYLINKSAIIRSYQDYFK